MKNSIILLLLLVQASTTVHAQDKMAYNIDDSHIALDGFSPVSYLDKGVAEMGNKEYKTQYDGVFYYFTSLSQKLTFERNPEKYLPQYGGYCAFGIYAGAKFRADPHTFLVRDGKYYVFLRNIELNALDLWERENAHDKLKVVADKNWQTLKATHN